MEDGTAAQKLAGRLALLVARWQARADWVVDEDAHALFAELASECAGSFPATAERALAVLARDERPAIRGLAVTALRCLLAALKGVSRTELLAHWVTSDDAACRVAMARALECDVPVVGSTTALSRLAKDDRPEVRAATYAAAIRRLEPGGDELAAVLCQGTSDRDADARGVAILGLKHLAEAHASLAIHTLTACARSTNIEDRQNVLSVLAELSHTMPSATRLLRSIAGHDAEQAQAKARRVVKP